MNITPGALVVILGFAIAISLFAGYLVGLWESRKKTPAAPPAPQPEPLPPADPAVLKVTLDRAFRWNLELDGSPVEAASMTPEQRQRLVNVIVQIRPWIDGKAPAPVAAPAPAPVAAPRTVPAGPAVPAVAGAKTQPPAGTEGQPPRIDIMRGVRSLLNNEVKSPEEMKGTSIVAMIDDYLQKKLAGTPLGEKGIRLEEGSIGEVVVFVGRQRYPGVDAIPDPEIQAAIRAAIADWDKNS